VTRIDGHILTPRGFLAGRIELAANGRVAAITGTPVEASRARESKRPLVLPGFIDLHVHGGGGHDVMDGSDAAKRIAEMHARHGTTALLATTLTAPTPELERALRAVAPLCARRPPGTARVLGVHLEGPYINPGKLGAQPDFARTLDLAELKSLDAIAPIRLITLAPEMPGSHGGDHAAARPGLPYPDRPHPWEPTSRAWRPSSGVPPASPTSSTR
jgi:N-acetylglucosamine-6-phosphate deacetylase